LYFLSSNLTFKIIKTVIIVKIGNIFNIGIISRKILKKFEKNLKEVSIKPTFKTFSHTQNTIAVIIANATERNHPIIGIKVKKNWIASTKAAVEVIAQA